MTERTKGEAQWFGQERVEDKGREKGKIGWFVILVNFVNILHTCMQRAEQKANIIIANIYFPRNHLS